MTETQIRKDFKHAQLVDGVKSYKAYKKDWIQRKLNEEKREVERLAKEKLKGQGKEEPENEV